MELTAVDMSIFLCILTPCLWLNNLNVQDCFFIVTGMVRIKRRKRPAGLGTSSTDTQKSQFSFLQQPDSFNMAKYVLYGIQLFGKTQ